MASQRKNRKKTAQRRLYQKKQNSYYRDSYRERANQPAPPQWGRQAANTKKNTAYRKGVLFGRIMAILLLLAAIGAAAEFMKANLP